jgi:superfamily II DNA or RNA helicase
VTLSSLPLASHYSSGQFSLLEDFYIPCLQEAISYDRAVGYFSSTLYQVAAVAYSNFVRRDGRIRLICSPALTAQDFAAMKQGEDLAARVQEGVESDLDKLLVEPQAFPATRLLATLIASGHMEVRVAVPMAGNGIFHDKVGIFGDSYGRRVSFVGSANETWAAWGLNHETFDVFRSWESEQEMLRARNHARHFERLWSNTEPGVRVEPLSAMTQERLLQVADDHLDHAIATARSAVVKSPLEAELKRALMAHQEAALGNWRLMNHRGVVAFATGAGKTLTALRAIDEWTATGSPALVLVPGRDLHDQWRREIAAEMPHARLLLVGAGHNADAWNRLLPLFTRDEEAGTPPRVTLSTNATATSREFTSMIERAGSLLVVADEVHRVGAPATLRAVERIPAAATLGLSATYRRQYDEEGTERLLDYFGEVLEPQVGLAEAILMGRLVPYDYRLHTCSLSDDEAAHYDELTDKIRAWFGRSGSEALEDSALQMSLIQRARILKQAASKVPAALEILKEEYAEGDRWLVYCDDLVQLRALTDALLAVELPVLEFHSEMTADRDAVLNSLRLNGGIVVAIRCLDEGIDLPDVNRALILASSTVEREYIQRRGRVLRAAPGKTSAAVHDLLLVDEDGGALTRSEAMRALEFARLARNESARERLKLLLALSRDDYSALTEHLAAATSGDQEKSDG